MRFGLHTGQHQVSFHELRDLWREAAAWGFDACYLFDHFVPLHSDVESFLPEEADSPGGPCLEAMTTLSALARSVPRINVGLMVAGVGYRAPGLLAHAAATVMQTAPGRLEIGIGAGWFEPDYQLFGLPFPPARERADRLARVLEAFSAWRRGDGARVDGVAAGARLPLGHDVRLWVAGTGERRILPLAARYADAWNAMYLTPQEFGAKVEVLREICAANARDAETLERSIALRAFCARDAEYAHRALDEQARRRGRDPGRFAERSLVGTPAECVEQLSRYSEAGATHLAVMVHPPYDREGLELLTSEVFPALR